MNKFHLIDWHKGGLMEFMDIHIGMKCCSNKGNGTVTWLDGSTQTIYMVDCHNRHNFEVNINDINEELQIQNKESIN